MKPLTDEQCNEFRRLPGSFNDMVRIIYEAGAKAQVCSNPDAQALKVAQICAEIADTRSVAGMCMRGGIVAESIAEEIRKTFNLLQEEKGHARASTASNR